MDKNTVTNHKNRNIFRKIALLTFLLFGISCGSVMTAQAANLSIFQELAQGTYKDFSDVAADSWYYESVRLADATGLVYGVDEQHFAPKRQVSLSEVVTLAVRCYEIYYGIASPSSDSAATKVEEAETKDQANLQTTSINPENETENQAANANPEASENTSQTVSADTNLLTTAATTESGQTLASATTESETTNQTETEPLSTSETEPEINSETKTDAESETTSPSQTVGNWYDSYVKRAHEYGLLPETWTSYEQPATRAQAAEIFSRILPAEELTQINAIEQIPDLSTNSGSYQAVLSLYQAGILTGTNQYGDFTAAETLTRSELTSILVRLVLPEQRVTFTLEKRPEKYTQNLTYGKSGAGRDLTAYQIGEGDKVLMLGFCIHGYEDNWAQDGKELVWLAGELKDDLLQNYDLIADNNWTIYILPCMNPDGLNDGSSNNGPGRCTTYYIDKNGNSVFGYGIGIDLNRCFEVGFVPSTNPRNYNGTRPLSAVEAVALHDFILDKYSSGHTNIFIDVHGWTQQIISSQNIVIS